MTRGTDFSELEGPMAAESFRELRSTILFLARRFGSKYRMRPEEIDDIVSFTLQKCAEMGQRIARGQEDPRDNRDAWLTRVVKNRVTDVGRMRGRRGATVPLEEMAEPAARTPVSVEERSSLRAALRRLEDACRNLLIRREVYGETRGEMARSLGVDENALGVRLFRCRKKLLALYLGVAVT